MPVTPRFSLRQDDGTLYIDIVVPYVRVTNMDFTVIDGVDFSFFCAPYLLKLHLPCAVLCDEDDRAAAVYDPDREHGTLTVKLPKQTPGEWFPNLDLLTTLLAPKRGRDRPAVGPLIQELPTPSSASASSSTDNGAGDGNTAGGAGAGESLESEVDEWMEEPQVPFAEPVFDADTSAPFTYGFAHQHFAFFKPLTDYASILENPAPDDLPASERRAARCAVEDGKFDGDRYVADWQDGYEDALCVAAKEFKPHWVSQFERFAAASAASEAAACPTSPPGGDAFCFGAFTPEEDAALVKIPNQVCLPKRVCAVCSGHACLRRACAACKTGHQQHQ